MAGSFWSRVDEWISSGAWFAGSRVGRLAWALGMIALLRLMLLIASRCSHVSHAGSTVYVFRHCVRNVDMSVLEPFTDRSFPSW